jgi:hypothetical protein
MALHSQPGVFALLVGSGTSTGAGVPTGWGVIKDLVRKAAAAEGSTSVGADPTDAEVEQWWIAHGDGTDLGYSALLEALGLTPAARSALIRGYFEPTEEDRQNDLKVPGKAHHAIASLARRGSVRVIVTTNFDSLLEQALDAAGVPYQVLSTDADVIARKPLAHANCTVLKVHGDYRSLSQKNTLAELTEYSPEIEDLLVKTVNRGASHDAWVPDRKVGG